MIKRSAAFSEKMDCYNCNGKMEKCVELIIVKGKTVPQTVKKCSKCNTAVVDIDEYERVRKELHPSFAHRIKTLFKGNSTQFVEILKGKVL